MKKIITVFAIIMMSFAGFADQYLLKLKSTEKPKECWSTTVMDAEEYIALLCLLGDDKKSITRDGVTTTQLDVKKFNKLSESYGQPCNAIDAKLVHYESVGEKY